MLRFIAILSAIALGNVHADDSREFAAGAARAEEKFHTTAGHDYAFLFVQHAGRSLIEAMLSCNKSEFPEGLAYDLIFIVGSTGHTDRVLANPSNPYAECIASHLKLPDTVPTPPEASWPVEIRLLHGTRIPKPPDPPFIIMSDHPKA
jgi:hypothetical protein